MVELDRGGVLGKVSNSWRKGEDIIRYPFVAHFREGVIDKACV